MHHAQVVVFESDGKLAESLHDAGKEHGFWLREVRQEKACLNLLRRGGPGVLVLRVGRDLERELGLLERVTWLYPDTGSVVVGDTDYPALASLAWDLGARYVLFPPQPRELLTDIVVGLSPQTSEKS
jgi:hypothetical protein